MEHRTYWVTGTSVNSRWVLEVSQGRLVPGPELVIIRKTRCRYALAAVAGGGLRICARRHGRHDQGHFYRLPGSSNATRFSAATRLLSIATEAHSQQISNSATGMEYSALRICTPGGWCTSPPSKRAEPRRERYWQLTTGHTPTGQGYRFSSVNSGAKHLQHLNLRARHGPLAWFPMHSNGINGLFKHVQIGMIWRKLHRFSVRPAVSFYR